jgi:N-acetyl-gamma-glutamyl-phosphate reductase
MHRVFIDGQAGTTGLEIAERLRQHSDIELLEIAADARKDSAARRELINAADVVVLCLPDAAAVEAVSLLDNPDTKVLDASSAHRVADGWCYGLAELSSGQREQIRNARLVSNPGCYPTGFILSVRPLIETGILSPKLPLRLHAVSGYSGGGRQLIEKYQALDAAQPATVLPPMAYGLDLSHKHVPEMHRYSASDHPPLFAPSVGHYYKGMLVHVPLFYRELSGVTSADDMHALLAERYADEACIEVLPPNPVEALADGRFLDPTAANDTNRIDLMIFGGDDHLLLTTRYDNLGKGASGAAIQNLNLMLGINELEGLRLQT